MPSFLHEVSIFVEFVFSRFLYASKMSALSSTPVLTTTPLISLHGFIGSFSFVDVWDPYMSQHVLDSGSLFSRYWSFFLSFSLTVWVSWIFWCYALKWLRSKRIALNLIFSQIDCNFSDDWVSSLGLISVIVWLQVFGV